MSRWAQFNATYGCGLVKPTTVYTEWLIAKINQGKNHKNAAKHNCVSIQKILSNLKTL